MSFSEIFRLHARLRAEKLALVGQGCSYSYATLDRAIDGCCHWLASRGVGYGDLVGVALGDHAEHVIALIALSRIGAVTLPMDCRWSEAEKLAVASHFGAAHLVVEPSDTIAVTGRIVLDASAWAGGPWHEPRVNEATPMILSLSSGTTGLPKGPRLGQKQFENRFMAYWLNLGLNAHDTFVSATPLYFGGGRGFTLAMVFAGATVHMYPPPYEPQALVDHVNTVGCSAIFLVPTLLRRLLTLEGAGIMLPALRCLISSGSALHMEERRAIRDRLTPNLYELYSSTEGGSVSVTGPQEFLECPESLGRPAFRVDVQVVDAQDQPLPAGETGRLRYRSPASPDGYFIGDSDGAFREGWFYPGDLACLDARGFLHLRGRSKDVIIRGGVNIYPGDVERVLLTDPRILDCAVVGVPSSELGEEALAYYTALGAIDPAALHDLCRAALAPYKVPRAFIHLADMPRNSLGKILKARLQELYADARDRGCLR